MYDDYDDPNWISSCNYSLERPYANMKGTHVLYNDFLASHSLYLFFTAVRLSWNNFTGVTVTLQTRALLPLTHTLVHLLASMNTELGTIGV